MKTYRGWLRRSRQRMPCWKGVYAAAVILPPDYQNELLNDSKKLTAKKRYALREEIERDAIAWAVGIVTPEEIDKINILNASFLAMHRALDQLSVRPEAVIVDGNRFKPYQDLPSTTIVKGDGEVSFYCSCLNPCQDLS